MTFIEIALGLCLLAIVPIALNLQRTINETEKMRNRHKDKKEDEYE